MKGSDSKCVPWYFCSLEKFSPKSGLWSGSLQLSVVCSLVSDAGTQWHMLVPAEIWGTHRESLHTGWATGRVNNKLPLLGRIKSSFSSAALAALCDGERRRQWSAVCVSYHRRVINVLSESYSSICLLSGGCMIQEQFMSFFWNQMVARQQNECQPHINVKCSNHYMST